MTQTANGFPYGLDPRQYGLSKLDYAERLRHHREMEHFDVMQEQRERDRVDRDMRARRRAEWIDPLNAFCYFAGTIFWCFLVWHVFFTILPNAGRAFQRADAADCLKDIDACRVKAEGRTP